jgi:hypothetical protein
MAAATPFAHRRRLADYLGACGNEIAIDVASMKLVGKLPAELGYIPRPAKWLSWGQRRDGLWTRAASIAAEFIWRCGGCGLVFALQWLQLRRALLKPLPTHPGVLTRNATRGARPEHLKRYLLVFSTRAGEVVPPSGMRSPPTDWITMPWVPVPKPPEGVVLHDVLSFLEPTDLQAAFVDALAATRALACRPATSRWVLQSYTAFRWFVVRRALEHLRGALVTAEHFDRWAVLADSTAQHLRAQGLRQEVGPTDSGWLELVQHGTIGSLSAADPTAALTLPRHLRFVSALYVYDAVSEAAFKRDVLSPSCVRRGFQVHHFRPMISLRPTPQRGACRVLFVGHPLCEALHLHLLKAACDTAAIDAYYKPHPTAKMSAQVAGLAWTLVTERDHFPEVDLLVSYPSTLVVEYANAGVPAVVHGMDERPETSAASLAALQQKLLDFATTAAPAARAPRPSTDRQTPAI